MTEKQQKPQGGGETIRFVNPEGPWTLVFRKADQDGMSGQCFQKGQESQMDAEITRLTQRNCNVYFHVAVPALVRNSKLKKTEIAHTNLLWVDIDCPEGLYPPLDHADPQDQAERDWLKWSSEVLSKLDKPPQGVPSVFMIISSGSGYHVYWKLSEATSDWARVEAAMLWLARALDGDEACHNRDRILRVPGTPYEPDKRKRDAGRKPGTVKRLRMDLKAVHALEVFRTDNVHKPSKLNDDGTVTEIKLGAAVVIESLDFLRDEYGIDDSTLVAIGYGRDRYHPKEKDNSRSAWVFHVCCTLARANVPPEITLGLLMDPEWGISESVLEMKDPQKYAERQVRRGMHAALDPDLRQMNEDHALVMMGDGVFCLRYEPSPIHTPHRDSEEGVLYAPVFAKLGAIQKYYMNKAKPVETIDQRSGEVKLKDVNMFDWWMKHPHRREYSNVTFLPNQAHEVEGMLNLWQGLAVDPKQGQWDYTMDHLCEVVADGNQDHAEYILNWYAYAVQRPEVRPNAALVFSGGQGVGKGIIVKPLLDIFGPHGLRSQSPRHLTGNFNAHLERCCLLFADEAVAPEHRAAAGTLKGLITESDFPLERKGKDVQVAKNFLKIIMASNEAHISAVDLDDRRHAIFHVPATRQNQKPYFQKIVDELKNGGTEAMLFDLLRRDISGFDPRNIPKTEAVGSQKAASLHGFDKWFFDRLCEGDMPFEEMDHTDGTIKVPTQRMIDRANASLPATQKVSANQVQSFFNDKLHGSNCERKSSGRPRGWIMPGLGELRQFWSEKFGFVGWKDDDLDKVDWEGMGDPEWVPEHR